MTISRNKYITVINVKFVEWEGFKIPIIVTFVVIVCLSYKKIPTNVEEMPFHYQENVQFA